MYLYYDNKNSIRFVSDNKTNVDKKVLTGININLTLQEKDKILNSQLEKKIIKGKLVFIEEKDIEKEIIKENLNKAETIKDIKEVINSLI